VPKDSLSIQLDRSELLIEGAQAAEEGGPQPILFSRAFRVPNTVDPDGVTAELAQGVLKVHLAKSEAAKPKRIEVRGG
jgi:HSP20 family molecular chaperone IbpA